MFDDGGYAFLLYAQNQNELHVLQSCQLLFYL